MHWCYLNITSTRKTNLWSSLYDGQKLEYIILYFQGNFTKFEVEKFIAF